MCYQTVALCTSISFHTQPFGFVPGIPNYFTLFSQLLHITIFFFFLKSHHIRYLSNESLLSLLPQLQKVSTSTFCFIWGCCSPVLLSWDHPRLLSWVCNHHFLNFMSFYFLVLLEAHFLSLFWLKMFFFYSLPHT